MLQALKSRRFMITCAALAIGVFPMIAGLHAATRVFDKAKTPVTLAGHDGHDRIALVIANADYPDANVPFTQSLQDARSLADSLQARGFDVDLEENVGKADMGKAVANFVGKVKPGVTALISFGGYGIQVGRENYLIPTDAHIWKEGDVAREGTSVNVLLEQLSGKGAAVTIAILDASRRNPFERRFRPVSNGLASVDAPRSTLVLSSMTPGKTISDADALRGRAIGTLVEAMKSGVSDAETLFNHTRQQVSLRSKGEQVPLVSSSLLSGFSL